MGIDSIRRKYQAGIRWTHFPLHPETPPEGLSLEELFRGRDLGPMRERMERLMAAAGLPYGARTMTYNSRLAQELGKWADTLAGGEALHDAIYRAYFADGKNIGQVDVLAGLAADAGLDPGAALRVLTERTFREAVDADWARSREYGITGVPTLLAGGRMLVGCQPVGELERFVEYLLEETGDAARGL